MDAVTLYEQEGMGLKKIAKLLHLSPRAVKKRLIRARVYQGATRRLFDIMAWRTPTAWRTSEGATVTAAGDGFLVYLPTITAGVACVLYQWRGQKIRLRIRLAPVSGYGGVHFGLRDEEKEARAIAHAHGYFTPFPKWEVTLACQGVPKIFFRERTGGVTSFFVSEIIVEPVA